MIGEEKMNEQVKERFDALVIKSRLNAAIIAAAPRLKKERERITSFLSCVGATSIRIPEDDKRGIVTFRTDVPDPQYVGQARTDLESNFLSVQRLANYVVRFTLSDADAEGIAKASAPEEVFQVGSVGSNIFAANMILAKGMEFDAIGAKGEDSAGDTTFVGLVPALLTTGLYGGVSTLMDQWSPNVLSNGGVLRPLTPDLMFDADRRVYETKFEQWTHVLMTPGSVRRYQQFLTYGARENTLYWKGCPLIRHMGLPSGSIVFVNSHEIEVRRETPVIDAVPVPAFGGWNGPPAGEPVILGDMASGISGYVTSAIKVSDGVRCTMAIRAALGLKSRRAHALICDIAEE